MNRASLILVNETAYKSRFYSYVKSSLAITQVFPNELQHCMAECPVRTLLHEQLVMVRCMSLETPSGGKKSGEHIKQRKRKRERESSEHEIINNTLVYNFPCIIL